MTAALQRAQGGQKGRGWEDGRMGALLRRVTSVRVLTRP